MSSQSANTTAAMVMLESISVAQNQRRSNDSGPMGSAEGRLAPWYSAGLNKHTQDNNHVKRANSRSSHYPSSDHQSTGRRPTAHGPAFVSSFQRSMCFSPDCARVAL